MGASALALARASLTSCGLPLLKAIQAQATASVGIFFHGRAPIFVAALEIEILVVGHTLIPQLAGFGGRSRHRHRGRLSLFDMVRKQRRGEAETDSENGAESETMRRIKRSPEQSCLWGRLREDSNIGVIAGRGDERRWTAAKLAREKGFEELSSAGEE